MITKRVTVPKQVREYLAEIGRKGGEIGGAVRSKKKAKAARANGKKGGRPKKENGNAKE